MRSNFKSKYDFITKIQIYNTYASIFVMFDVGVTSKRGTELEVSSNAEVGAIYYRENVKAIYIYFMLFYYIQLIHE